MTSIFGWMADNAGCAWYRLMLPLGTMRQKYGLDTRFNSTLLEQDWECDVLIAQRTCLPGPTGIFQRLAKVRGKRPLLVMELDDDLLHVDRKNKSSEFFGIPEVQANLVSNIRVADLVTVSTEPLAEQIRKYNPNVAVLPNCIPAQMLQWQPGCYTNRFTIGWQGSPTHNQDWAAAAAPIQRWFNMAKKAGLNPEMHTMGATPSTFPEVHPHRHTKWNPDIAKYYPSLDWHVALAPLAPTLFNESKSDLRVLEAAMLGFPVVASDVVAYRDSVDHGNTGLLVSKASDWGKSLQMLAENPDLRVKMGEQGRQYAATRTVEANVHRWLEAYGLG